MNNANTVRIGVPVRVERACDLSQAVARAALVADIIELRLDYLEPTELGEALRSLATFHCPRPLILTLRPAEEGGHRPLDMAERQAFWSLPEHTLGSNFVDIELDLLLGSASREPQLEQSLNWEHVICSYHNFAEVPADLETIYERMASTGARVLKIVVPTRDVTDCLPVFRLLERARREGHAMIAIAVGDAGLLTRILAPSRGAFLTFGSLNEAHQTAPGQISARELRDMYRVKSIDENTLVTGIIGCPIMHSVSPHMHNRAFAVRDTNAVYIPFEVHDAGEFVRRMVDPRSREMEWNLRGLSVTAPHKQAIMKHLNWIEPAAQKIGAVNTVVIEGDELHGYNTDAAAVLAPLLGVFDLQRARVAVIGAGGAARAVLWSVRQAGAQATVFARNIQRAAQTAGEFGMSCELLDDARFDRFDLVINTTPLGTRGQTEDQTPATVNQLRGARLVYDLVYNPRETRLMREARTAGCETINGLAMLVAQAAAQFKLWTGDEAPTEAMHQAAEQTLTEQRSDARG
ncbi:MAG: shikimate dehydrogenase [Pyrinomonadaceae bacterium]|nr:shikimate dehydrogenase [Pyrinomonadaceae bacterium]